MDKRFTRGEVLFRDDFTDGLRQWSAELEKGGRVEARGGTLELDVPAGCTLWFKPMLEGPVMVEYEATVVSAGGANDRVSDLNCFWMARDVRRRDDLFAHPRTGKFADYNQLMTYYVGLGGSGNTTTRFRRYIGDAENRPLRAEHDLARELITPNVSQRLRLIACGKVIQFHRDERKVFEMLDEQPYTSGWFGFRTVTSHLLLRKFRVYRLRPE